MSVYFHANFGLNRANMSSVLSQSLSRPNDSAAEIAKPLGYKAPFVQKQRVWLVKTGIIQQKRGVDFTEQGKIIWDNDPKFSTNSSQFYMHKHLCSDPSVSETWHYFLHEFLVANESFSKSDLAKGLSMKLMPHDPKHFAERAPMIKVITRKILDCYTMSEALGALGIITQVGKDAYRA